MQSRRHINRILILAVLFIICAGLAESLKGSVKVFSNGSSHINATVVKSKIYFVDVPKANIINSTMLNTFYFLGYNVSNSSIYSIEIGDIDGISDMIRKFISYGDSMPTDIFQKATYYYNFSQATGNLTDSKHQLNSSKQSPNTTNINGIKGKSWNFTHVRENNISFKGSIANGWKNLTINLWAYQTRLIAGQYQLLYYENYSNPVTSLLGITMRINELGNLILRVNTDVTGDIALVSNKDISQKGWQMITLRYNGTHLSSFINGTPSGSAAGTGKLLTRPTYTIFGSGRDTEIGQKAFEGALDELYISNKSLSLQEIKSLYAAKGNTTITPNAKYISILNQTKMNKVINSSCNCVNCTDLITKCRTPFTLIYSSGAVDNDISHSINYTINLTNCSTGQRAATFRTYNEELPQKKLNATYEVQGTIYFDPTNKTLVNFSFPKKENFSLCISPFTAAVQADIYIKYHSVNGVYNRFYLYNETLQPPTVKNYTIYILNKTTGYSSLSLTLRHYKTFNPLSDIIAKLQKNYVSEGLWRTVQEYKSGEFGEVNFWIFELTQDYRLLYYNTNNTLLKMTESSAFRCNSGLCEITQQLNPNAQLASGENPFITVQYSNSTNLISTAWIIPSGNSAIVRSVVELETGTGTKKICDSIQNGASGTFSCNTSNSQGILLTRTYVNNVIESTQTFESLGAKLFQRLSNKEQVFWSFLILLACFSIGLASPILMLILLPFGLVIMLLTNILNPISIVVIMVAAVGSIVIGMKVQSYG